MGTLTRAQILAADDLKEEVVDVPEWGGSVIVRSINGQDRDQFEIGSLNLSMARQPVNMRARLVVLSCFGEDGKRIFKDEDIESVSEKNALVLDRLFTVAARLSGITEQVRALTKKNSRPTTGPGSSSASASLSADGQPEKS